jgi:5-deoxy-D-glucuronate isomerase
MADSVHRTTAYQIGTRDAVRRMRQSFANRRQTHSIDVKDHRAAASLVVRNARSSHQL